MPKTSVILLLEPVFVKLDILVPFVTSHVNRDTVGSIVLQSAIVRIVDCVGVLMVSACVRMVLLVPSVN